MMSVSSLFIRSDSLIQCFIRHHDFHDNQYFVPDFENFVVPMRDAPLLAKEPELKKVDENF
jgi:hypothetical protein